MYFVLLVIEKLTGIYRKNGKAINVFKWFYTILFVVLGWVIFRAESIGDAAVYLGAMFRLNGNAFADGMFAGWFEQNVILLSIGIVLCTPVFRWLSNKTQNSNVMGFVKAGGLICLMVLSVASLVGNSYNPFIYFNF